MVEPHILAMMLQVKLLLGLGQTAGKNFIPSLLSSSRNKNRDELQETSARNWSTTSLMSESLIPHSYNWLI